MCIPASVATNQNSDIIDIMLQFHSLCSNGYDWTITVELNAKVNDSINQNNQTYNLGTPATNYLIGNVTFIDYNCSWVQISTHTNGANQSGTVMFDVDWVNSESKRSENILF